MNLSKSDAERLMTLQHEVIAGTKAMESRNRLLLTLFDEGATQSALAALLNEACRDGGANEITTDAVFAAVKRQRAKQASTAH